MTHAQAYAHSTAIPPLKLVRFTSRDDYTKAAYIRATLVTSIRDENEVNGWQTVVSLDDGSEITLVGYEADEVAEMLGVA